jgi:hypothetical protein
MARPPEQKRSRARTVANLFCLFLAVLLVALFFLAVFHFRPRFDVAALSTAAFVIILLCFIQRLDPIIGALALRIHPQYPIDLLKKDASATATDSPDAGKARHVRKARKDLNEIERELQSLESRTDLSRLEMLEYMETMIQKQKLAAEKLKEGADDTVPSMEEEEQSNGLP